MDDNLKLKESVVANELRSLGIAPDVASVANGIYVQSGRHFGSNKQKRLALLYECCYKAYIKIGLPVNPTELGNRIGISSKKSTIVGDENVYFFPSVYLDVFCTGYNLTNEEKNMIEDIGKYLDSNSPPTTAIVAGLITAIISFDEMKPEWWSAQEKKKLIEKSECNNTTVKNAINKYKAVMIEEIKSIIEKHLYIL